MRGCSFRMTMLLASLCMGLGLMLGGCGSQPAEDTGAGEPANRDFFAMDTYMTVTAYGERAAEATEAAETEVMRLDRMLSTGNADSEIARLNSEGRAVLSAEAGALVKRGLALYKETGDRFDIAIFPLVEAWGFTDQKYRVPSEEEINALLPLTDPEDVKVQDVAEGTAGEAAEDARGGEAPGTVADSRTPGVEVSFAKKGMAIDLGGIAKGYTSSRIMDIYRDYGITSGLVSLGGNVQVLGTRPDGSDWRVAIRDPGSEEDEETMYLGVLEAADTAVISSGAYERYFTQGGIVYHHIIDPATGHPANSDLQSVTIICRDGTLADALSTSLYIMGKDKAIEYWRSHASEFDCILLDSENELYVTAPVADQFSSDRYHVTAVE